MKGKTKITIQGHLDKKWKNSFEGMKISYEGRQYHSYRKSKRRGSSAWSFKYHKGFKHKTSIG